MKKKLTLFILIFLIPVFAWASGGLVFMSPGESGDYLCPSGTYLFAWDGDYIDDSDKGCFTNGTVTKDGTLGGSGTIGAYGESGSNGFWYTADGDFLKWLVASADGLDPTEGTIYMRIYMVTSAATEYVFESYYNGTNFIYVRVLNSNEAGLGGQWSGNAYSDYSSSTVSDATWTTIGVAWKYNEVGTDFSVTHDGTTWNDKDKDFAADWATDPAYLCLGTDYTGSGADDFYITKIVVLSTFKESLPDWW